MDIECAPPGDVKEVFFQNLTKGYNDQEIRAQLTDPLVESLVRRLFGLKDLKTESCCNSLYRRGNELFTPAFGAIRLGDYSLDYVPLFN